jgi:glycosyltransferase involved in cell wall biosynthesis
VAPIRELIQSRGLERQVIWAGHVPDNDITAILSGANLLVYPSLYEGFGIPILEAMLCDVPVITSDVSSMPEVSGDAALLVDPLDVRALTEALARLLTDPELRERLVRRGRIQRARFSYERMASQMLELYQSIM